VHGPDLRASDEPLVIEVDGSMMGAGALDGSGALRDVVLYRDGGDEVVLAPTGQVTLADGTIETTLRDGEIHRRLPDGGYARGRFASYHVSLPLPLVRHPGREPFELLPQQLRRTIDERRAARQEIRFHLLALHRRISGALAVPLLALLAWGVSGGRRGRGAGRGLVAAVVLALAYYLLLRLGDHGLRQLHWPPLVAAYLATAALALTAALLWRRRWSA
jgi:lipopolysaccharide export LptBFGC system permease protein LptF